MKNIELHPCTLGSFVGGLGNDQRARYEAGREGTLSGALYDAVGVRMLDIVSGSLALFRGTPVYDILVHARDEIERALASNPIDVVVLEEHIIRIEGSRIPTVSGSLRARITSSLCDKNDPYSNEIQLLAMTKIVGALENFRVTVIAKLDGQITSLERLVTSSEENLKGAEKGLAALGGTAGKRKKPATIGKGEALKISKTVAERALGANRPRLERRRAMREAMTAWNPKIHFSSTGTDSRPGVLLAAYVYSFVKFLRSADGRKILQTCDLNPDAFMNFDIKEIINELLSEEVELSAGAAEARNYSRRYSAAVSDRNRAIKWAGVFTAMAVALVLLGIREVNKDLPAKLDAVNGGFPADASRTSIGPCPGTACPPDEEIMTNAVGKFHGGIIEELKREPFRVDLTIDPDDDARVIFAVGKRTLPADVMKVQFLLSSLADVEGGGTDQETGTIGEILEDGSTTSKSYPEAQVRDALIRSGTMSDEVGGEVNIFIRTDSGRTAIITMAVADFVTTVNEQLVARWGLTPGAGNRTEIKSSAQSDAQ